MKTTLIPTRDPKISLLFHVTRFTENSDGVSVSAAGDVFLQFSVINTATGQSQLTQVILTPEGHDKLIETLILPQESH